MGSTDEEVDDVLARCNEFYVLGDCNADQWEFDAEQPSHTVVLDAFWIDRTEVTSEQYALCVAGGGCSEAATYSSLRGGEHPAQVDWENATAYCQWAGARLPSEAEWEYAARGPERRIYPWGNAFDGTRLNFADASSDTPWGDTDYDDGYQFTAPVGSYPDGVSWCGALDMAGNAGEWVADWYGAYPSEQQFNPMGPASGDARIARGGASYSDPFGVRTAQRHRVEPGSSYDSSGFRCARSSE